MTLFVGVGCTSTEEPATDVDSDEAAFELSTDPQILSITDEAQILFGCSNQQIRSAQDACRNTFCGSRGSNGIHFCDQRPPNVVAQCDCKTGADPTIVCSLTNCPQ